MKFRKFEFQVLLLCVTLFQCDCSHTESDFGKYLDNIFLDPNLTSEGAGIILMKARESYRRLKGYEAEKDPNLQEQIRKILLVFEMRTIEDLTKEGMNVTQLFENINSYIPDLRIVHRELLLEEIPINRTSQLLLEAISHKLSLNLMKPQRTHGEVEKILGDNAIKAEEVFKKNSTASSVGYFFLESFATILGLAWGIISMIMAGVMNN